MATATPALVEFRDVTKRFTAEAPAALDGVTLSIRSGEILGIIGESGAGKSTLLELVNGLGAPTAGSVTVSGADVATLDRAGLRALRRDIGIVFQGVHLLSNSTVRENVRLPLRLARRDRAVGARRDSTAGLAGRDSTAGARRARTGGAEPLARTDLVRRDSTAGTKPLTRRQQRDAVDEMLSFVGLSHRAGHYPAQLSGGERQRVGLARALVARPSLLLCDEPTSSLDASTTGDVLRVLSDARTKLGTTVVVITHDLDVVKAICDRAALLENGRLREVFAVDSTGPQSLPTYYEQVKRELM